MQRFEAQVECDADIQSIAFFALPAYAARLQRCELLGFLAGWKWLKPDHGTVRIKTNTALFSWEKRRG